MIVIPVVFVIFSSILSCATSAFIPEGLIPMLDGRIVGGQTTKIENFPHQISMRYLGNHRCGGSIIGKKLILTAAHCVDGIVATFIIIRAGITQRDQIGVERSISKVIMHGGYNKQTLDNDIAVINLIWQFDYSTTIQPITLTGNNEEAYTGRSAIVSGWGATREGGPGSNILQFVEVSIISTEQCNNFYSKRIPITKNMICAGNMPDGGRDACQGDSGGPLIIYDDNNTPKQVGVVSWGYGCARPNVPGVYSRISILRDWIDESIRILKN